MYLAFELGRELSDVIDLPASVAERVVRARLVHEINPPMELVGNLLVPHDISRTITMDGQRVLALGRLDPAVTDVAVRLLPDVVEQDARASICLRLWAGCLDGAKIIAMETRSGPNTANVRAHLHTTVIVPRAAVDPIYAAGAEAALAFKRLHNQPTSFDGVPCDSILLESV